jgi:hypothetical protein
MLKRLDRGCSQVPFYGLDQGANLAATHERSPTARRGPGSSGVLRYSQLTQGNDTDSFGATAGSILGAYFGPGYSEERWLAPFNDDIHTALARFYERSLSKLAKRMGKLPGRTMAETEE